MRNGISCAIVVSLLVVLGCSDQNPLLADCDRARDYLLVERQIDSLEDVPKAFQAVGLDVPAAVASPLDARILLAQQAVDCGCERKTNALVELGELLLERGDVAMATQKLEDSLAISPTIDAYGLLAEAYDRQGRHEAALEARRKRESLLGQWDRDR